ncbi:MAG: flagella basal body P-ring formation protein FlgA [Patescibacteria group bacterium]|nr:flagella basal body P-ring formation protein FlgA [Patescibacteria group bacterium]
MGGSIIIFVIVVLMGTGVIQLGNINLGGTVTTPEKTTSTFTLWSYPDGEDVSNFVEMDIWTPKSSATFDDMDDVYTMSNFERAESGKDADDISIDLRDEAHVWAEITGNSVFANIFRLLVGGVNYDYEFYVYHPTSDVNFNILDSNLNASWPDNVGAYNYNGDDNHTVLLDAPHLTQTVADMHYGTGWDLSATDFADYTDAQKNEVWDEKNWRVQAPYLDPTLDTADHEYIEGLEAYTEFFAIRITFDASISTIIGNVLEVNVTVAKGENVRAVISGTFVYLLVTEVINFENGAYDFKFEMYMGDNISVSTVQSGRVTVPNDVPVTFTAYSSIGV